ncbi:CAF20 Cap-associated protein CAF20 [Candida maltosa Xu316]|uniref:Cap-associated protein CAF20 n=1 Tax=Candida maltosa (strain Xu316) TaxID=1245528 RepID=M3K2R0_CANMX|nr:Cap-associated protein CAF20 [Candida maltosa Xu316]
MAKYTEEQLFELQTEAHVPNAQILDAFNKLIDEVKISIEQHHQKKWNNGDTYIDEHGNERSYHHMNRRRPSKGGAGVQRPNLRKKSEVVVVDEDGWATMAKPKKASFAEGDALEERNKFKESTAGGASSGGIKARPNNKNLGSSKAVDPREISDKQTKAFNAFAALDDDDEDEDEDDE